MLENYKEEIKIAGLYDDDYTLVEYFPQFAESGSTDAYEWYVSHGHYKQIKSMEEIIKEANEVVSGWKKDK
jgi:hypothetical protein